MSEPPTNKPPEPPKPPAPAMLTLALVALTGLVVGTVLQEFRWRNSANSSEGGLEYAERAFQKGDDQTALNLFSKLATHNNPNAEYWLGHMYEIGLGIPRDAKKAIDLYKKAADQNVVGAEARLGDIYLSGDQIPPDFVQAKYYLDRAAYHGDPRSAMLLGQMYRVGPGIPKDLKLAYAWSEVASLEGSEFAKRERDDSLRDLSVSDQDAAVAQAKDILKEIKRQTTMAAVPKAQ
jgi:TPR repeat protein